LLLINKVNDSFSSKYEKKYKNNLAYKCLIGNSKKWKLNSILFLSSKTFKLRLIKVDYNKVLFSWDQKIIWNDLIGEIGKMPIPPYLNRNSQKVDNEVYQTIYSKKEGAIASPTAGLHFTKKTFKEINKKKIKVDYLTLHVGLGTFKTIESKNIYDHKMHVEEVFFTKKNLENILEYNSITAVGTTSIRILESIYWFGVQLFKNNNIKEFNIKSFEPYEKHKFLPTKKESILKVIEYMNKNNINSIEGQTSIFIFPGYKFMICNQLITNFHLPKSTLILLIASFIGNCWKKVYKFAKKNNYRFFSYGDSSLLFKKD
tara:strand:- start:231 stop:1178 length:948 start_codon:yes stop_codon:yes gene_type:complete